MVRRIVVVLGVLVSAVVCGTALALAPLWLSAAADLDPEGRTCWIEHDPGSGPAALGVERAHGGLVPYTECVPVADIPNIPEGEAFNEAARRALAGEAMPVSATTLAQAENAETHPLYRSVWPLGAVLASAVIAVVFGIIASAIGRHRRGVHPAQAEPVAP